MGTSELSCFNFVAVLFLRINEKRRDLPSLKVTRKETLDTEWIVNL